MLLLSFLVCLSGCSVLSTALSPLSVSNATHLSPLVLPRSFLDKVAELFKAKPKKARVDKLTKVQPTLNKLNATEARWAYDAMVDWVERDHTLAWGNGMAAFHTSGRVPEGGAIYYLCNFGNTARVTRRDINMAVKGINNQGSDTGFAIVERASKPYHPIRFGVGLDTYCEGPMYGCRRGRGINAVNTFCRTQHWAMFRAPLQADVLVTGPAWRVGPTVIVDDE